MNKKPAWFELVVVLGIGLITSLGLFLYSIVLNHGLEYAYLILNLGLAFLPLAVSTRLVVVLRNKRWSDWEPLILTFVWIVFLPNSFYMVSDFIHLQNMPSNTILYNVVMFSSFIFLAVGLGIISLYQVHKELKRRLQALTSAVLVALLLVSCCFAIYLGRDLRWDSWDLLINPGGVLFDISNLILKPSNYPDMGRTLISFFVLLGSVYLIAWQLAQLMWHKGVHDLAAHIKRPKLS